MRGEFVLNCGDGNPSPLPIGHLDHTPELHPVFWDVLEILADEDWRSM